MLIEEMQQDNHSNNNLERIESLERKLSEVLENQENADLETNHRIYQNIVNNAELASRKISATDPLKRHWYKRVLQFQIKEKKMREQKEKQKKLQQEKLLESAGQPTQIPKVVVAPPEPTPAPQNQPQQQQQQRQGVTFYTPGQYEQYQQQQQPIEQYNDNQFQQTSNFNNNYFQEQQYYPPQQPPPLPANTGLQLQTLMVQETQKLLSAMTNMITDAIQNVNTNINDPLSLGNSPLQSFNDYSNDDRQKGYDGFYGGGGGYGGASDPYFQNNLRDGGGGGGNFHHQMGSDSYVPYAPPDRNQQYNDHHDTQPVGPRAKHQYLHKQGKPNNHSSNQMVNQSNIHSSQEVPLPAHNQNQYQRDEDRPIKPRQTHSSNQLQQQNPLQINNAHPHDQNYPSPQQQQKKEFQQNQLQTKHTEKSDEKSKSNNVSLPGYSKWETVGGTAIKSSRLNFGQKGQIQSQQFQSQNQLIGQQEGSSQMIDSEVHSRQDEVVVGSKGMSARENNPSGGGAALYIQQPKQRQLIDKNDSRMINGSVSLPGQSKWQMVNSEMNDDQRIAEVDEQHENSPSHYQNDGPPLTDKRFAKLNYMNEHPNSTKNADVHLDHSFPKTEDSLDLNNMDLTEDQIRQKRRERIKINHMKRLKTIEESRRAESPFLSAHTLAQDLMAHNNQDRRQSKDGLSTESHFQMGSELPQQTPMQRAKEFNGNPQAQQQQKQNPLQKPNQLPPVGPQKKQQYPTGLPKPQKPQSQQKGQPDDTELQRQYMQLANQQMALILKYKEDIERISKQQPNSTQKLPNVATKLPRQNSEIMLRNYKESSENKLDQYNGGKQTTGDPQVKLHPLRRRAGSFQENQDATEIIAGQRNDGSYPQSEAAHYQGEGIQKINPQGKSLMQLIRMKGQDSQIEQPPQPERFHPTRHKQPPSQGEDTMKSKLHPTRHNIHREQYQNQPKESQQRNHEYEDERPIRPSRNQTTIPNEEEYLQRQAVNRIQELRQMGGITSLLTKQADQLFIVESHTGLVPKVDDKLRVKTLADEELEGINEVDEIMKQNIEYEHMMNQNLQWKQFDIQTDLQKQTHLFFLLEQYFYQLMTSDYNRFQVPIFAQADITNKLRSLADQILDTEAYPRFVHCTSQPELFHGIENAIAQLGLGNMRSFIEYQLKEQMQLRTNIEGDENGGLGIGIKTGVVPRSIQVMMNPIDEKKDIHYFQEMMEQSSKYPIQQSTTEYQESEQESQNDREQYQVLEYPPPEDEEPKQQEGIAPVEEEEYYREEGSQPQYQGTQVTDNNIFQRDITLQDSELQEIEDQQQQYQPGTPQYDIAPEQPPTDNELWMTQRSSIFGGGEEAQEIPEFDQQDVIPSNGLDIPTNAAQVRHSLNALSIAASQHQLLDHLLQERLFVDKQPSEDTVSTPQIQLVGSPTIPHFRGNQQFDQGIQSPTRGGGASPSRSPQGRISIRQRSPHEEQLQKYLQQQLLNQQQQRVQQDAEQSGASIIHLQVTPKHSSSNYSKRHSVFSPHVESIIEAPLKDQRRGSNAGKSSKRESAKLSVILEQDHENMSRESSLIQGHKASSRISTLNIPPSEQLKLPLMVIQEEANSSSRRYQQSSSSRNTSTLPSINRSSAGKSEIHEVVQSRKSVFMPQNSVSTFTDSGSSKHELPPLHPQHYNMQAQEQDEPVYQKKEPELSESDLQLKKAVQKHVNTLASISKNPYERFEQKWFNMNKNDTGERYYHSNEDKYKQYNFNENLHELQRKFQDKDYILNRKNIIKRKNEAEKLFEAIKKFDNPFINELFLEENPLTPQEIMSPEVLSETLTEKFGKYQDEYETLKEQLLDLLAVQDIIDYHNAQVTVERNEPSQKIEQTMPSPFQSQVSQASLTKQMAQIAKLPSYSSQYEMIGGILSPKQQQLIQMLQSAENKGDVYSQPEENKMDSVEGQGMSTLNAELFQPYNTQPQLRYYGHQEEISIEDGLQSVQKEVNVSSGTGSQKNPSSQRHIGLGYHSQGSQEYHGSNATPKIDIKLIETEQEQILESDKFSDKSSTYREIWDSEIKENKPITAEDFLVQPYGQVVAPSNQTQSMTDQDESYILTPNTLRSDRSKVPARRVSILSQGRIPNQRQFTDLISRKPQTFIETQSDQLKLKQQEQEQTFSVSSFGGAFGLGKGQRAGKMMNSLESYQSTFTLGAANR